MSGTPAPIPTAKLARLGQEIQEWNGQINLVTRVDTKRQLRSLIRHCCDGWELVRRDFGTEAWFEAAAYIDVGSGAGLPGLVWALGKQAAGHVGPVFLVEPRAKRAWFLRRTARLLELAGVIVVEDRWGVGELPSPGPGAGPVLISLKALRLNDGQILLGLLEAAGNGPPPEEVVIARFMAPARTTPVPAARQQAESGPRPGGMILEKPAGEQVAFFLVSRRVLGTGVPRLDVTRFRR